MISSNCISYSRYLYKQDGQVIEDQSYFCGKNPKDIMFITDPQGHLAEDYEYDPWCNQANSFINNIMYDEKALNYDGYLYFYRYRYYNPYIAIFISRYMFFKQDFICLTNNPKNFSDPFGLSIELSSHWGDNDCIWDTWAKDPTCVPANTAWGPPREQMDSAIADECNDKCTTCCWETNHLTRKASLGSRGTTVETGIGSVWAAYLTTLSAYLGMASLIEGSFYVEVCLTTYNFVYPTESNIDPEEH